MKTFKQNIRILCIFLVVLITSLMLFGCSTNTNQPSESTSEPVKDPKTSKIEEVKNSMSDEELVGQLFLARVPEENQIEDIQNYHLGGYLIFGQDVENETTDSLKEKISSWQASASTPMIIASDEEGGDVTRVSQILSEPFPSPASLYAAGGLEAVFNDARTKSQTLKSLGINVNLAPVADVAVNPDSFMYSRTLGLSGISLEEAAQTTAEYVSGVVQAMHEAGEGCSLKHFPGYGENGDTHTDIVRDERELATLERIDFIPFKAGIQAGAGSVLISHNIAVAIDPDEPASISPQVHDILRNELGFNGVIMTDDLDMAGLADFTDQKTAAVKTVQAGTDLIISSSYADQESAILEALKNGSLSRDRFDEAISHVLGWKYDLGLLN